MKELPDLFSGPAQGKLRLLSALSRRQKFVSEIDTGVCGITLHVHFCR